MLGAILYPPSLKLKKKKSVVLTWPQWPVALVAALGWSCRDRPGQTMCQCPPPLIQGLMLLQDMAVPLAQPLGAVINLIKTQADSGPPEAHSTDSPTQPL